MVETPCAGSQISRSVFFNSSNFLIDWLIGCSRSVREFVVAGVGRVFQGVEYSSRREACQARHREYVRALADGLNFTQAAHAVGVSKRTGKVWRNGALQSWVWVEVSRPPAVRSIRCW